LIFREFPRKIFWRAEQEEKFENAVFTKRKKGFKELFSKKSFDFLFPDVEENA